MSENPKQTQGRLSRPALVEKFRTITHDRVERLNLALLELEKEPDRQGTVEDAQRELHTLKGEAKLVGFATLSSLTHKVEELFLFAAGRGFRVDPSVFDGILSGLDSIGELVDKEPGDDAGFDLGAFAAGVDGLIHDSEAPGEAPGTAAPSASDLPSAGAPKAPSEAVPTPERKTGSDSALARMMKVQTANSVQVDLRKIDLLTELVADLSQDHLWRESSEKGLQSLTQQWRAQLEAAEEESSATASPVLLRFLESQRQLLGELQGTLAERREASFDMGLRLAQVEERFREIRMVPLGTLFVSLPRAVRDLGQELGKNVRLEIQGEQVEIDQRIHGRIQEPLLHLVRNAVDHGLESPEQRPSSKVVEGCVRLVAEQRGASVSITVSDDGRGLDPDGLRRLAVKRGLLSAEEAADLDRNASFGLIFRPGFSTREEATELSGRGVGLDVVKTKIEALGGSVRLESTMGKGVTFELTVPVTLTFRELLLVRSESGGTFALAVTSVVRVLRLAKEEIKAAAGSEVFDLDSEVLPVIDLDVVLGLEREEPESASDGGETVVVLQHGGDRFGLRVAHLVGERALLHRNLNPFLDGQSLVAGTAVLEGRGLALILNLPNLAAAARANLGTRRRQRAAAPQKRRRRVLVVDDSDLTRLMLVEILRGLGHRVFEASNGREALDAVPAAAPDLILLDLEMPVMTGFEFLEAFRASDAGRKTPVIVFSSLGAERDKKRCLDLGANAYLVKSSFEEADLERAVARFL